MDSENVYTIRGKEIFIATVKPIGNTGHVYIPKCYMGQKITVVIHTNG